MQSILNSKGNKSCLKGVDKDQDWESYFNNSHKVLTSLEEIALNFSFDACRQGRS